MERIYKLLDVQWTLTSVSEKKQNSYWFPAKRNISRPNKHGVEVVVEDKNSPVYEHEEVNAACRGV